MMVKVFGFALFLIPALPRPAPAQEPPLEPEFLQTAIHAAEEFVSAFLENRIESAAALYDSSLAARSSPMRLQGIRMSIFGSMGAFQRRGEARIADSDEDLLTVVIPLVFERSELGANVRINRAGRVAGFSFLPGVESAGWRPPSYAEPGSFREREVRIHTPGEEPLEGLLAVPEGEGPFPGVVMLHGAGPGNRDAGMGATLPFRDLAWGLASNGIAVLRYDKRSFAFPQRFEGQAYTVVEEIISDARAALDLLGATGEIDPARVFLLGHSMGGMLAPRIAEMEEGIAGLIMLAAPSRQLTATIRTQVEYLTDLPGAQMAPALIESTRASLNAIDRLTAEDAGDPVPLMGAPAAYWLDLSNYDQVESARRLSLPMLFLQGGRDFQVTTDDYSGWRAALEERSHVAFKLYPDLNHLFIAGEGPSSFDEYQKPGNVCGDVIVDIVNWIR